jgi:hypothetical protein
VANPNIFIVEQRNNKSKENPLSVISTNPPAGRGNTDIKDTRNKTPATAPLWRDRQDANKLEIKKFKLKTKIFDF